MCTGCYTKPEPHTALVAIPTAAILPPIVRRSRHPSGLLTYLLVSIALISQLALGAMVLPDTSPDTTLSALDAVSVLCGTDQPSGHVPPSQHRHTPANPALCPISVALALPSVIPTTAPEPPVFSGAVVHLGAQERPPARGPPSPTARVGTPRGPPLTA